MYYFGGSLEVSEFPRVLGVFLVTKIPGEKQELCFNIDRGIWDVVARIKEKENIKIENIIEMGIATHYNMQKSGTEE